MYYTESLFNFPDNGSEEQAEAMYSTIRQNGKKKKKPAKRFGGCPQPPPSPKPANENIELIKKRGRPPSKQTPMKTTMMSNMQEMSTNNSNVEQIKV